MTKMKKNVKNVIRNAIEVFWKMGFLNIRMY